MDCAGDGSAGDALGERLAAVLRHFPHAVDLGTPGGALVQTLAATGKTGLTIMADPLVEGCSSRQAGLAVAADGTIYVDGEQVRDDDQGVARIRARQTRPDEKLKALIAGDRRAPHGAVMHAIELAQRADITGIALENERP